MGWGIFFSREFWHALSVALRRSRKDPRARKILWRYAAIFAWIIGALLYYGTLLGSLHDPATVIAIIVVLIVMFAIGAAVAWSHHREKTKQDEADMAAVPREITDRVQRLAHGLAAVVERGLSEAWLLRNSVPEGKSVISRQITLEALRRYGAWNEMPQEAREWLIYADGLWPPERIAVVLQSGEILTTLLWALGLRSALRPVTELLEPIKFEELAKSLAKPAIGLRPTWDLRVERNTANLYFARGHAERIHRGELQPENEEHAEAIAAWMQEIAEKPGEDFLLGASTVSELGEVDLYRMERAAALRLQVLHYLMQLEDGKDVWDELTRVVYVSLLVNISVAEVSHQ